MSTKAHFTTFKAGEVAKITGMTPSRQRVEVARGNLRQPTVENGKAAHDVNSIAEMLATAVLIDHNMIKLRQTMPNFAKKIGHRIAHWALRTEGAVDDTEGAYAASPVGMKVQEALGRPMTVTEALTREEDGDPKNERYFITWGGGRTNLFSPDLTPLADRDYDSDDLNEWLAAVGREEDPVATVFDLKHLGQSLAHRAGRPLVVFHKVDD